MFYQILAGLFFLSIFSIFFLHKEIKKKKEDIPYLKKHLSSLHYMIYVESSIYTRNIINIQLVERKQIRVKKIELSPLPYVLLIKIYSQYIILILLCNCKCFIYVVVFQLINSIKL